MRGRWYLVTALMVLSTGPLRAAQESFGSDAASLRAEGASLVAELKAAPAPDAKLKKRLERFSMWVAVQGPAGLELVQSLLHDPAPEARAFGGELLVWCGRGDTYSQYDKARPAKRTTVKSEALGPVAAALMADPDPFLRGMGEWALASRLGDEYEADFDRQGQRVTAKAWPGEDAPEWYRQWARRSGDELLEYDYARQAVAVGAHRSTAALLRSADDLVRRAEGIAAYARARGTAAQGAAAAAALKGVHAADAALRSSVRQKPSDAAGQHTLWMALRRALRDVCLANPDLSFSRILFGLRRGDGGGGNITFGRANSAPPGGDLMLKSGLSPADPAKALIAGRLGPGHVKGLDLWFDADRLVFAYAKQPEMTTDWEQAHLYEMGLDGGKLRQLTAGKFSTDQEPCYLPNGDIVFVSDRSFYGSQCAGALQQNNMILNLYRCDGNGGSLRPLSNNKDFDRHPHLMDDGNLLFLHWEYLDRHIFLPHTLWAARPDGTMDDALYKQHYPHGPMSLREARQVWGQHKLVAIGCGHHNSDVGAVILADYTKGINEGAGMRILTPGVSSTEGGYGPTPPPAEGGVQDNGGYYRFPYPLSEKSFLTSYSYNTGGPNYALYYIDVWGNKELIHRDLHSSVAFLTPVRRTPRPPMAPEVRPASGPRRFARTYLHDVYEDLPGVPRGTVKYLRISQPTPWPCVKDESSDCGFNDLHYMSTTGWAPAFGMWGWGASRAIGTVPVEADGSAYFQVPAGQPVYFQALDKDFVEVRRMRSYVTFMEGETRGCTGCHETRLAPPPAVGRIGLAARRAASVPLPPPIFGNREVPDFETHIQPILDRRCASCHGEQNPAGGVELTSRKVDHYNQSYRSLFGLKPSDPTPTMGNSFWNFWYPNEPAPCDDTTSKATLKTMHVNQYPGQLLFIASRDLGAEITPTLAYGSSISRFTKAVLAHRQEGKVKDLTADEWEALVTWVDLNAQYWGTFVDKESYFAKQSKTCRRVRVIFPDPWEAPPAGEWYWANENEVRVRPAPSRAAPAAPGTQVGMAAGP